MCKKEFRNRALSIRHHIFVRDFFCCFIYCVVVVVVLQLADTKSHDKRLSLLQFIVKTVRQKFPEIQNFESDLQFVEKAATGDDVDDAIL